jgi:hypothetical protein
MKYRYSIFNKKNKDLPQYSRIISVIIMLILIQASVFSSFAQVNVNIGNQKTIGGDYKDWGICVKKLGLGYVALMQSGSSISSDRTVALKGVRDYWLVGLNSSLVPIWQKSYGGSGVDEAYDMLVTPSNDIIMVGLSDSPISGNKTVANYGYINVWIVCTDSVGTIKWQKVYGGSSGESRGVQIIQLSNGNYVVGTSSFSGISGTKTDSNRGNTDYWLFCIDSVGNQIWDKTIGGSRYDILTDMVQISNNELILAGSSNSPISGDKSQDTISFGSDHLDPQAGKDVWVVKYDYVENKIIWDRVFGGEDEDGFESYLSFDGKSIYIAAYSASGISGTKTTANLGSADVWINKIDTAGNLIWDREYGGVRYDGPNYFTFVDNALIVGATSSSPISTTKSENDVGPSSYYSDYWVFSMDTSGSIIWDKTIGGNSGDGLSDILVIDKNHLFLIGNSISSNTGYKSELIRGNSAIGQRKPDAWIVELLNNVGVSESITTKLIVNVYPNPSTKYINIGVDNSFDKINQISVFSILGRNILNKEVNAQEYKMDISKLQNGVYIIEGRTVSGTLFRVKFVKY